MMSWAGGIKLGDMMKRPNYHVDDVGCILAHAKQDESAVFIVLTTQKLLANIANSCQLPYGGFVGVDATFRLNTSGLPLMTLGTVGAFYPFLFAFTYCSVSVLCFAHS